jgi:hypothetical protein
LRDKVEQIVNLLGAGPDLALVNYLDAFAEQPERRLAEAEQASNAGAKCIHGQIAVRRFDQKNLYDVRICDSQAS